MPAFRIVRTDTTLRLCCSRTLEQGPGLTGKHRVSSGWPRPQRSLPCMLQRQDESSIGQLRRGYSHQLRGGSIKAGACPARSMPPLVCSSSVLPEARPIKEVCKNRKAKFDYELLDKFQCGIELQGTEVKSVRAGKVSLQEAFCRVMDGEMILFNANIAVHNRANSYDNHDPIRKRRLLMQKREIRKLKQKQDEKGLTLVPLRMYFSGSWLKVEIALAKGKNTSDKREDIKKRESNRDIQRITKLQY